MVDVRCADVARWVSARLGLPLFAKRRQALGATTKPQSAMNSSPETPNTAANS